MAVISKDQKCKKFICRECGGRYAVVGTEWAELTNGAAGGFEQVSVFGGKHKSGCSLAGEGGHDYGCASCKYFAQPDTCTR